MRPIGVEDRSSHRHSRGKKDDEPLHIGMKTLDNFGYCKKKKVAQDVREAENRRFRMQDLWDSFVDHPSLFYDMMKRGM